MEYIHPEEYKTKRRVTTEDMQNHLKAIVEKYCLKCDLFMGKDHDFSDCLFHDVYKYDEVHKVSVVVEKKTCPFENMDVPWVNPKLKCKSE